MGLGPFSTPPIEGGGGGGGVSGLDSADGGIAIANEVLIRGDGTTGIQGSTVTLNDYGSMWVGNNFRVNISANPGSSDVNNPICTIGAGADGVGIANGKQLKFSTSNNAENVMQQGLAYGGTVGSIRVTNGSTGIGSLNAARTVAAEITSPETIADTDSRKVITNEGAVGAVTYNLPAAAAGLEVIFIVHTAQNMVVTAATGDTIRIAAGVSSAGGTVTNGTVGGVLHLVCLNATEWFAISSTGTWTPA